jgi:phosphatidylglycerophosphate synthase
MLGGETTRVSMLGSDVSLGTAMSSVALDRGLFIISGATVTIAGIAGLLLVVPVSHGLQSYAAGLVFTLLCLVIAGAVAIRRKWRVLSAISRAAAPIPAFQRWFGSREAILRASEEQIFDFYHDTPGAFWSSFVLNVFCHFLAVTEVYICLQALGAHATLTGALILEALTKLINVAGAVNPGNVGMYEAGNIAMGKLLHFTGGQGLMLALCRRVRAIFWALVGAICLIFFSKRRRPASSEADASSPVNLATTKSIDSCECTSPAETALILARGLSQNGFEPVLASVGTLPVLMRAILDLQSKRPIRTVVVVDAGSGSNIRKQLAETRRLPMHTEWMQVEPGTTLSSILRDANTMGGRVLFISGNCTYGPALFRALDEWNGECGPVEFVSAEGPIGLFALPRELATELAQESRSCVVNETDLHCWLIDKALRGRPMSFLYREAAEESCQTITTPRDCLAAERKLDQWLVKPTDGIFARMNRRISIPISRMLIKTPITPNMVSVFTLALSIAGAGFFALGGYWNCLSGAVLGVVTSILDGCDGEVARLKLQVSNFGCWIDSVCDNLYYIITFAGIIVGLVRSTGDPSFLRWGIAIFAGAFMTFVVASVGRKLLSGNRPEQYLAVWQKKAENESAGLILRLARRTEFIVRRCFLPYFLLLCAVLNLVPLIPYMAALGANVAWIVSLRSVIAFSTNRNFGSAQVGVAKSKAVIA